MIERTMPNKLPLYSKRYRQIDSPLAATVGPEPAAAVQHTSSGIQRYLQGSQVVAAM